MTTKIMAIKIMIYHLSVITNGVLAAGCCGFLFGTCGAAFDWSALGVGVFFATISGFYTISICNVKTKSVRYNSGSGLVGLQTIA